MMRLLIPVVFFLLGVGGGIGAGMFLGGGTEEDMAATEDGAADPDAAEGAEDGTEDMEGESAAEEEESEPSPVEPSDGDTEFVRLNNQFVVPVVRDGSVRSLVVMGLTVEVNTGLSSTVYAQEPRLRDSFLRVLFAHANAGGFDGMFTQSSAIEPLREALLEAAEAVLGAANAHDILITDITRQDA